MGNSRIRIVSSRANVSQSRRRILQGVAFSEMLKGRSRVSTLLACKLHIISGLQNKGVSNLLCDNRFSYLFSTKPRGTSSLTSEGFIGGHVIPNSCIGQSGIALV